MQEFGWRRDEIIPQNKVLDIRFARLLACNLISTWEVTREKCSDNQIRAIELLQLLLDNHVNADSLANRSHVSMLPEKAYRAIIYAIEGIIEVLAPNDIVRAYFPRHVCKSCKSDKTEDMFFQKYSLCDDSEHELCDTPDPGTSALRR